MEYVFIIPSNLSFDKLFMEYPLPFFSHNVKTIKGRIKLEDRLAFILDSILRSMSDRGKDLKVTGTTNLKCFVPLFSTILKENLGDDYTKYINYLEAAGVIVISKSYSEAHSREYSLNSKYLLTTAIKAHKVQDVSFLKKLEKFYLTKNDFTYLQITNSNGKKLNIVDDLPEPLMEKMLYHLKFIKINSIEAIKSLKRLKNRESRSKILFGLKDESQIRYLARLYPIFKIENKQFYIKRDSKGRRIYTNLTSLKKELREFLSYNGEQLIELDIANSQPYFLNMLFAEGFFTDVDSEFYNFFKIFNIDSKRCNELIDFKSKDLAIYKSETSNGSFYKFMKAPFEKQLNKTLTEKEVKQYIFGIFFSKNSNNKSDIKECKKVIAEIFPTLNKLIIEIKKDEHASFAILMQRIESYIMLDIIATKLTNLYPNIPIFSIHDSILCLKKDKLFLKNFIETEIKTYTHTKVTIKDK